MEIWIVKNPNHHILSGGENACLRGVHLCDVVGSLPRPNGVQHVRTHVQDRPVYGPVVSHVRQNLHLHQLVYDKNVATYVFLHALLNFLSIFTHDGGYCSF